MNYKTNSLAIAITAVLVSTSALSAGKTDVYGEMRVSIDSTSVSGSGLTAGQQDGSSPFVGRNKGTGFKSNASRLGIKGYQDTTLADTQMIYQAEMEYSTVGEDKAANSTTTGNNSVFVREAYAGLKNKDYGQVRLGRLTTGYKASYVAIDPWTDHIMQARQDGQQGVSALNSNYVNNAVEYVSPMFGGVQLNAFLSEMTDNTSDALYNAGVLSRYKGGTASGAGIKYLIGDLRLTADAINIGADNAKSVVANANFGTNGQVKNGTAKQFTAQYKFSGGYSLGGVYEDVTEINQGVNNLVVFTKSVGQNGLLTASYGLNKGDNSSVYGKKDGTTMGLGGIYKLTDTSSVFAGYSVHNRDTDAGLKREAGTFTVGIDAKF